MEPTMIRFKISTTAAVIPFVLPLVLAFVLPMTAPTASFAQNPPGKKAANGPATRTGWARPPRYSGAAARWSGGVRPNAGAGVGQAGRGGGNWRGAQGSRGNEGWRGDRDRDRDQNRGFVPGLVTGAIIGGALASQSYGYYGGPGYYEDQYYDDPAASPPAPVGDDAVTYCIQNFSSYDPASGTYLGNDGLRHPCP
jgi:BA14K-like protein